jgi:hypothetical protein
LLIPRGAFLIMEKGQAKIEFEAKSFVESFVAFIISKAYPTQHSASGAAEALGRE